MVRNEAGREVEERMEDEEAELVSENVEVVEEPEPIFEAHLVNDEEAPARRSQPEPNDTQKHKHQNLEIENVVLDEPETRTMSSDHPRQEPLMVEASLLGPNVPRWKNRRLWLCTGSLIFLTVAVTLGIVFGIQNNRNDLEAGESIGSTKESFVQDSLPSYTRASLDDPLSDQSLALEWLWKDADMTASLPLFRRAQRYAMAVNFLAGTELRSEEDREQTRWMTDLHECDWPQNLSPILVCEDERLVIIDLAETAELGGTIPPEIALLADVAVYKMAENKMKGTIPSEIGLLSNSLEQILLNGNHLGGPVPSEVGNLGALLELDLARNQLTSSLPTELGRLSLVRGVEIHHNKLTGTIPTELGELSQSLFLLAVHSTLMTGFSPSELGFLTFLEVFASFATNVTGTLPTEMGSLVQLTELFVNGTLVSGTTPTEMGLMTRLTALAFYETDLSGTFPLCGLVESRRLMSYTVPCERVQCSCTCSCQTETL